MPYYTTTRWDGERRASDYWIELATTPQPFGGRRWWFICPQTGRRAAKLYLPNGAFTSPRGAHSEKPDEAYRGYQHPQRELSPGA